MRKVEAYWPIVDPVCKASPPLFGLPRSIVVNTCSSTPFQMQATSETSQRHRMQEQNTRSKPTGEPSRESALSRATSTVSHIHPGLLVSFGLVACMIERGKSVSCCSIQHPTR